jgi:c(7)-type cytochrome triheme protein
MKKNCKAIPFGGVVIILLALGGFILGSCASSGSDSQTEQTKQDVSDQAVAVAPDDAVKPFNRDQALEILAKSDQYLNPVGGEGGQDQGGGSLSIPHEGASESPRNDGIHDTQVNSIATLQDPTKALADFPRDRRNQVDWVAALDQGLIEPRADLRGEAQMQTMDMDILMKNTQYMPWVKFPHLQHTKWLACSNCHPDIFIPKQDANPISMNKVLRGQYCGVCHDKVAFALFICERCHSVPHEGSGKKWW